MNPLKFQYESMGTKWEISIWDKIDDTKFFGIQSTIIHDSQLFDSIYSRFKKNSLIWKIAGGEGIYEVPEDLTKMLGMYKDLYGASNRKLNPLIGFTISDLGYDENYSLVPKEIIRLVPDFEETLKIIDSTHIKTKQKVLIDLGALGKGYFVDLLANYLKNFGIKRFLVDGSGDIFYVGEEKINVGLEHPTDKTKIIGSIEMKTGAMCASGIDRRKWPASTLGGGEYNHVIDPETISSPKNIIATWVMADSTAFADGLATCLFFVPPENFSNLKFEYCILSHEMRVKKSNGFNATLY